MTERKTSPLRKRLILSSLLAAALIALGVAYTQKNAEETPTAGFAPSSVQSWKNYLKNYPDTLAQYQKEQEKFRREAKPVKASEGKNIDDLIETYPFLQKDLLEAKKIQQEMADSISKNPNPAMKQSLDAAPHLQVAEDRDSETGINLFFLSKSGRLWCSPYGCPMDVYVDTGTGYQKAGSFIAQGVALFRDEKNVFLYAGSPQDAGVVAWVLKGQRFVEAEPPPSEPESQAFLEWKTQLEKMGMWPPQ